MQDRLMMKQFLFLILSGCALFSVPQDTQIEERSKATCLNSTGKGRFSFQGHQHIFSFRSFYFPEELKWRLFIDFPAYGGEELNAVWSFERGDVLVDESYEKVLLANSQNLDPYLLDQARLVWKSFFLDYLIATNSLSVKSSPIVWKSERSELVGNFSSRNYRTLIGLKNLTQDGYFGLMDFALYGPKQAESLFRIELVVRSCLEKLD